MAIKSDLEYIKKKKFVSLSEFNGRFAYPSFAKLALERLQNKDLVWLINDKISIKNKPVINLSKFTAIIEFYNTVYESEYFENNDNYINLKICNIFEIPFILFNKDFNNIIILQINDFIKKIESWSDLKYTIVFSKNHISINSYNSKRIIQLKKSDFDNINKKTQNNIRVLCECIVIFKNSIDNINNKINEMGIKKMALIVNEDKEPAAETTQKKPQTKQKQQTKTKQMNITKLPDSIEMTEDNITIEQLFELGNRVVKFFQVSRLPEIFNNIYNSDNGTPYDVFVSLPGAIFQDRKSLDSFLEITQFLFNDINVKDLQGKELMSAITFTLDFIKKVDLLVFFHQAGMSLSRLMKG